MKNTLFIAAILALTCLSTARSAENTLIAHWTFDQTDYAKGLYLDVSGNDHHAAANTPPPNFVPGVNGNTTGALDLYANPAAWATAGTFDPGQTLTISAWVKLNPNASGDTCITAKRSDSAHWDDAKWEFLVQADTAGIWANLSTNLAAPGILDPPGQWQHLCLTIDANGTATLYKNAVKMRTFEDRAPGPDDSGTVAIGARANGTIPLHGTLDDVRIYNYPLPYEQIAQLYVDQAGGEICADRPSMDFNNDCIVDYSDLMIFASHWLEDGYGPLTDDGSLPYLPPDKTWTLVFNDEFEGTDIDLTKWTIQGDWQRKGGWWTKDNSYLDGQGNLILRVRKDGDRYTSGAVWTKDKFEHKYGYWEARCKLPHQPGHWSAFWIQCAGTGSIGNEGTDGTEIDVMEWPYRDGRVQHALHWDGYGEEHQSVGQITNYPAALEGWHRFGVWWTPTEYIFYIDGNEVWRTSAGGVSQVPEYVYLSEEIGSWAGDITQANLPDYFTVDYVRVYDVTDRQ
ncbi:Glucan endo-1,3-beta-glucosidase A1 precursor [Anaerohalosphaera lusitana]|uniref:Glucan endo-1,3-beta-glucosidase A1 n=1 Tax=Anaerohalosphaera lusitana TaxID=1936003 RepID=A0A1U9NJB7_9BACT|nr:LamG-like jellyroll fold domain-containing protein [Anaerohalosphaera lusitana]AQT67838.1 Glucan endo-1,3-beta-glucosidase A1 precursor [Anaerohalosphaera lusitana]